MRVGICWGGNFGPVELAFDIGPKVGARDAGAIPLPLWNELAVIIITWLVF